MDAKAVGLAEARPHLKIGFRFGDGIEIRVSASSASGNAEVVNKPEMLGLTPLPVRS
jgi:hypothetical protein